MRRVPNLNYRKMLILMLFLACQIMGMCCIFNGLNAGQIQSRQTGPQEILIERPEPDEKGGQAYRLIYRVPVPVNIYWRFKTDFENDFLLENKFIVDHRLISRDGNTAITENRYTSRPGMVFRWKTTFSRQDLQLHFVLLNPESSGHKFHFGHICLIPQGNTTQVVQEAYFDFFGASFWAVYPWSGGMKDFLKYTARWEYDMVLKLYEQYKP
ncbi:MAG: hypothetical protein R6U27_12595 [Desulfobacterales bacterium]